MGQEERLLVLQMVADKKITAAEGVELLRAMDIKDVPGSAPAQARTQAPAQAPVPPVAAGELPAMPAPPVNPGFSSAPPVPPMPPSAPNAPEAPAEPNQTVLLNGSNLGSGLSSFIEEVVDRVSSVFGDIVGPRYEFTYELTGEFAADIVDLRVQTGNGRVEVKAWDEPGYKAVILVKARGNSEEDARNRAHDAYSVRSGANLFELESRRHDWHDIAVHVTLFVPKGKRYSLETRTGNGHVEIHELQMTEGRITTGNGRVVCIGSADRMAMRSGNGSVEIEGDYADLEAGSGNGSVTIRPNGKRNQNYRLTTGNGSIRFDAVGLPNDVGFRAEANTGMGGIHVGMSNLVYDRDIRTAGHKQIIARTPNFDVAAVKVNVSAKTGMGSISVG